MKGFFSSTGLITILVFSGIKTAPAQQKTPSAYTLQQCIDLAIKNNLDVTQSELQMKSAKITWDQARENLLPTVGADLSHSFTQGRSINQATNTFIDTRNNGGNYGLNANIILFNGLSRQQAIRRDALAYQAGRMDFQQAKDNITLNIIQAFLTVLNAEDQLNQTKVQVDVSAKQVDRLKIMNADGAIKPSEYYDLQGQFGDDQLGVVDARNAMYAAELTLVQYMNVPFEKDVKFVRSETDKEVKAYASNPDAIYQTALKQFSQVKAVELRTASAVKAVKYFKGLYFPTLSFGYGLGTRYSAADSISFRSQFKNNYNTYASFGLTIPIFNNLQNRNQVRTAKLDLQNAQAIENTTKIQLRQNIEQAYVNMTTAYERLNVLNNQVKAYAESFRTAEVRFNTGEMNSVDFLVAKRNLDRSNIGLINSRYNYINTMRVLDYYYGKLSLQ